MKKTLGFCSLLLLAAAAWATPANTPTLDGRPIEYDSTDLRGTFYGASAWGPNGTLTNLFVTWDSEYVYIGFQAWQASNNKIVVLLDVDPGAGTGATTTTNWTNVDPSFIKYNDYGWVNGGGFGLDYMLASEGTYNNIIRVNYDGVDAPSTNNMESLFDSGNGAAPVGTPIDMACLNDATACPHKGFEVRIPWTNLYAGTRFGTVEAGEIVPRGATLHLLAGIHNNDPASAWSSPDTIPNQTVVNHVDGILTTADYLGVVVDVNADGIPDVLAGDVNAPYILNASGAAGGSFVYVAFNEGVTAGTVQNTANWTVAGVAPSTAVAYSTNAVLLGLATPIASTDLVLIRANGVADASANARAVEHCLFPAASAIPQAVTVTFQVNTNSGMGISGSHPRPTAFFVNGGIPPLEWGDPPAETNALAPIPGSNGWTSMSVTFLPGSPTELSYKYSARIEDTNNYEAIRLSDFASGNRKLVLNTNGAPMTVVDYLGAAAYPRRNPGDTNVLAHNQLYQDGQRGDAGIRGRREILFQLDLSLRKRDSLARVMVMGSDPLRGFNWTGLDEPDARDFPGSVFLDWTEAGIQLFDDGTHGDVAAADGIYARLWAFSADGKDSAVEPTSPYSLVGGNLSTEPYVGYGWSDQRSPRSFIYKYFVLTTGGSYSNSPNDNLEYYVADPADFSQIVLPPFAWDNDFLPPPPPSNAPALSAVSLTGTTAYVEFENVLTETAHGVRISTNLLDNVAGFADYGLRAVRISTNGGVAQWAAAVGQISAVKEYYAPYAGSEPNPLPIYWEPSAVPATASVWRVHFSQYKDAKFAGNRAMGTSGSWNWGVETPMTFLGDGHWAVDIALPAGTEASILEWKFRSGSTWANDPNNKVMRGGPATWTPDQPTPDQLFAVTLDVAGTPIAAATNVNVHLGYDSGWLEAAARPMTNTAGTVWEYAVVVPTNYSQSVNWVFNAQTNGSDATIWYSPADWKAFMTTLVNP